MPWLVSGSAGQYSSQTWWPRLVLIVRPTREILRREHCACGGGPPVTLDTRCGAYERREASYEVDEVKGKGVP